MKRLLMWFLVHTLLGIAIVGYTWQNSAQQRMENLVAVVKFALSPRVVLLVVCCNLIFVVVFYAAVHYWGMDFWEAQLAY